MRTITTLNTTGGMQITWPNPTGPNGLAPAAALAPPVLLSVTPAYGAAGAAQLTAAGVVAMLAAVNTACAAYSDATDAAIYNGQPDGGYTITVSPRLVQVPCAYANVATLTAALAAVLAVGANVTTI